MKNFGWVFGLVEMERDGQKCLMLCEVYDTRGIKDTKKCGSCGAVFVDWKQFRSDKAMIIKDLHGQTKYGVEFYTDPKTKDILMRRRKPKSIRKRLR